MNSSILSGEVSGGLFEVASAWDSPPTGPGVGKAVAITRSSPREKATGLKALAEREFIAGVLEGRWSSLAFLVGSRAE